MTPASERTVVVRFCGCAEAERGPRSPSVRNDTHARVEDLDTKGEFASLYTDLVNVLKPAMNMTFTGDADDGD